MVYSINVLERTAQNKKCASGSVGGARPCQGRGRGFESRLALFRKRAIPKGIAFFFVLKFKMQILFVYLFFIKV